MASSLFGNSSQMPMTASNPMGMMQQLQQFAGLVRGRGDPQKLVMNYMQQNGIPPDQLQQVMQQAQGMCRMLGLK